MLRKTTVPGILAFGQSAPGGFATLRRTNPPIHIRKSATPDGVTDFLGGRGWIRTTEALRNRFTVCQIMAEIHCDAINSYTPKSALPKLHPNVFCVALLILIIQYHIFPCQAILSKKGVIRHIFADNPPFSVGQFQNIILFRLQIHMGVDLRGG